MEEAKPAGFWARGGASFLDAAILWPTVGVLLGATHTLFSRSILGSLFLVYCLSANAIYFIIMTASWGQTLGKKAVGMKVVTLDGTPVTLGRSIARWAASLLVVPSFGLSWLIAAFTPHKRALHDYLAGTRLVYLPNARPRLGAALGALYAACTALVFLAILTTVPALLSVLKKSTEAVTIARLGSVRSTISLYYGETEGRYPADDLTSLTQGKTPLLKQIPALKIPGHARSSSVRTAPDSRSPQPWDQGGWLYVNAPDSKEFGNLYVDCTHTDSRGTVWSAY